MVGRAASILLTGLIDIASLLIALSDGISSAPFGKCPIPSTGTDGSANRTTGDETYLIEPLCRTLRTP
jgi:hypothetical protein